MIDFAQETAVRLHQAARLVPASRGARKTHPSTILRWILKGVIAPGGEIVRLEAARLGGAWITSEEALQRFSARLTPDLDEPRESPRPPAARARAAERAERELERLGI